MKEKGGTLSKLNDRTDWSCMHKSYDIDRHLRTVCCSMCGVELDAFDILRDLSSRSGYLEMMEADGKRTAQRVAFLKGEERKVKARVKNANRKDADAAVKAERDKNKASYRRARWRLSQAADNIRAAAKHLGDDVQIVYREGRPTEPASNETTEDPNAL